MQMEERRKLYIELKYGAVSVMLLVVVAIIYNRLLRKLAELFTLNFIFAGEINWL